MTTQHMETKEVTVLTREQAQEIDRLQERKEATSSVKEVQEILLRIASIAVTCHLPMLLLELIGEIRDTKMRVAYLLECMEMGLAYDMQGNDLSAWIDRETRLLSDGNLAVAMRGYVKQRALRAYRASASLAKKVDPDFNDGFHHVNFYV